MFFFKWFVQQESLYSHFKRNALTFQITAFRLFEAANEYVLSYFDYRPIPSPSFPFQPYFLVSIDRRC